MALVGGLIGAILNGVISDRVGRKPVLIASLALMAVGSALTPLVLGYAPLLILRFVVGLGLGAALPCVVALTAEFSSARTRSGTVAMMFTGYPLGAAVAGLAANALLPRFGWHIMFWICAAVPFILMFVVIAVLPESVGFAARRADTASIQVVLRRLGITGVRAEQIAAAPRPERSSFVTVFQKDGALGIVVLSLVLMLSLLISYFMLSWIPIIGAQNGLSTSVANLSVVLASVGSIIAGIVGGMLLRRIGAKNLSWIVTALGYALGAVAIAGIGFAGNTPPGLLLTVFFAGFLAVGAQLMVVGLSASFFDESVRATGVGIAVAVGRVGAIIGPLLGGVLLQAQVPVGVIFLIIAALSVLCAIGIVILGVGVLRVRNAPAATLQVAPETLV